MVTVLVFFSDHCPHVRVHDARLVELVCAYDVRFLAIDSEVDAMPERDAREATTRRYPFPILIDPRGNVAFALGAEYATVVIDGAGNVRYRGAFDDQRTDLRPGENRCWMTSTRRRGGRGRRAKPAASR